MHLGEFERFSEAERNNRPAPLHPLIRCLPGAEEVHLASGWARWPNFS